MVKVEFEDIIALWQEQDATTFVANRENIILFSTDTALNHTTLEPLSDQLMEQVVASKQFGDRPLALAPLEFDANLIGFDRYEKHIQAVSIDVADIGWRVFRLQPLASTLSNADARFLVRIFSVSIFLAIGISFFIWRLYVEQQRTKTTAFLKNEIARGTKELSDANAQLESEMQKRAEINQRFRTAREDLAQANRLGSIGAVTAGVAHEINQPVAAIRAFAENASKLLARDKTDAAVENLTSIVELTGKIGSITNELRRYARRGSLTIRNIELEEVIEGVDLLIGDRIKAAGVHFQVYGVEDLPLTVKAGRVRLEQVFVNILQNALEALKNSANPTITIRIEKSDKVVDVVVFDNGPGIPEDVRSEIFNPFFSSKPDGLGIGLGIAKDIMKEFGGSISLIPSELGGAGFKLTLQRVL